MDLLKAEHCYNAFDPEFDWPIFWPVKFEKAQLVLLRSFPKSAKEQTLRKIWTILHCKMDYYNCTRLYRILCSSFDPAQYKATANKSLHCEWRMSSKWLVRPFSSLMVASAKHKSCQTFASFSLTDSRVTPILIVSTVVRNTDKKLKIMSNFNSTIAYSLTKMNVWADFQCM